MEHNETKAQSSTLFHTFAAHPSAPCDMQQHWETVLEKKSGFSNTGITLPGYRWVILSNLVKGKDPRRNVVIHSMAYHKHSRTQFVCDPCASILMCLVLLFRPIVLLFLIVWNKGLLKMRK